VATWVEVLVVEDEAELADRGVRQLRRELEEVEVETRDVRVEAPEGSKGNGAAVGAVAVALGTAAGAGGAIPVLIAVLRDWLGRRGASGGVKLTIGGDSIEVDRATVDERQQLIEGFLRAHVER
jgi:hypothetical protein